MKNMVARISILLKERKVKKKKFSIDYQVSFLYREKKDIKKRGSRIVEATTKDKAIGLFVEMYYSKAVEEFVTLPKDTNYIGTSLGWDV